MIYFNTMNFLLLISFLSLSNSFSIKPIPPSSLMLAKVNRLDGNILPINYLNSKKISLKITKVVSSVLAGADHTGHNVLHTNSQIIHKILDSKFLSFDMRKDLALMCIKFAQFGDHTGHNILSSFHHFVDKFL